MPIKLGASHVVALLLALPVVGEDADAVHVVVVGVEDLKAVADLAVDVAVRLISDTIAPLRDPHTESLAKCSPCSCRPCGLEAVGDVGGDVPHVDDVNAVDDMNAVDDVAKFLSLPFGNARSSDQPLSRYISN